MKQNKWICFVTKLCNRCSPSFIKAQMANNFLVLCFFVNKRLCFKYSHIQNIMTHLN